VLKIVKGVRRLVCRVFGHEWALTNSHGASWGMIDPSRPEMLAWRVSLYTSALEHPTSWQWVCRRCAAQVPFGQSETYREMRARRLLAG
jgi:uncharacterized protein YfaT (DUF1175 family)